MGTFVFAPASSDHPLHQIQSDHVLIEKRLALLMRLMCHLRTGGCDNPARQTASHILNCLDETAFRHHEDEEIDLFPATLGAAPVEKQSLLRALVGHLSKQHRDISVMWGALRLQLLDVVCSRRANLDDALCENFHSIYVAHIEHEEGELLPLALNCLGKPALDLLGQRLAARRSVALADQHVVVGPFRRETVGI